MALNVGYFRTWYGNFQATDNLAVTPADFDPFCVTMPVDARLLLLRAQTVDVCHVAPERLECLLATGCGVEVLAVPGADAMRPLLGVMPLAEVLVHRHLLVLSPSPRLDAGARANFARVSTTRGSVVRIPSSEPPPVY